MTDILHGINLSGIVGTVAGILTASSMLPQLIKTIKKKESEEIALGMLIVLDSGIALWICYGVLQHDYPIIITNSFSLLVNIFMLIAHFKYKDNSEQHDNAGVTQNSRRSISR
jgi:MtN3 and saliva related transmembrane protein